MRSYTTSSRLGLILLVLSYCLLWSISASAQLAIGSDGLSIKSGTPLLVDRLVLSPDVDATFSATILKRSATALTYNGTPSIEQVYTFTTPIVFQGILRIYYETSTLNGIDAEDLMLVYSTTTDGPLTALPGSVVNSTAGFVEYEFDQPTTIQKVTAASDVTPPIVTAIQLSGTPSSTVKIIVFTVTFDEVPMEYKSE